MNTESELRLQAYLDNEVSSSEAREIASWIARDAEAKALCQELQATKAALAPENELPVNVPDSREFYWSKIERAIEHAEREPVRRSSPQSWWLRLLAPVAGTALLAIFVFTSISFNGPEGLARGGQRITSETDSSITFYSPEHHMNVIWIASAQPADESDADGEDDF
jgi:anti-sigma factor RsiW